ncbi:MAG TPA: helix-turn-helix transcriptional regulator [Gemmataceae bacterium]|jgi:transcriptional regulator with XRE-family HTH domain
MSARDTLDPDGSLWHLIAVQLRRHREERNISGAALARLLDLDRSSVSRQESGGMKLQEKHARLLDRQWRTDGLFSCLVRFAKAGHDVEWFKTHIEMEVSAAELRIWELAWVPGLFQTEAYARAVLESDGLADVEGRVAVRLKRQEALNRTPPPQVWIMLDQGVIDHPVGSPKIMYEQLASLVELARLPNISVRVAPRSIGAHPGRDGSFKIMTVGGADVAYTEACGGGRLVVDGTEVRSFRLRFDRIGDWALPVDASIDLIQRAMEELR